MLTRRELLIAAAGGIGAVAAAQLHAGSRVGGIPATPHEYPGELLGDRILTPALFARKASGGRWKLANHLAYIDRVVCETIKRGNGRLIVMMPPRTGKTEYFSRYLPAWFVGHNPYSSPIIATYESSFAARLSHRAMKTYESHADWFLMRGRERSIQCAGVGGALCGRGTRLLIGDDLIKNYAQAHDRKYLNMLHDWWMSSAMTRLEPGGTAILVMSHWHSCDPAGRLIRDMRLGGEKWDVIRLPAIAKPDDVLGRKPGDALWPARYDASALDTIRRTIGLFEWESLYQQRDVFRFKYGPRKTDGYAFLDEVSGVWDINPRFF